ncbi:hypothetical protein [Streptomyces sp. NPDC001404]|uniref:hypothetical protein n=1 Tax=Streptomyces sp. NPDC001404 TaxID=3364571 RepID=UPI0036993512
MSTEPNWQGLAEEHKRTAAGLNVLATMQEAGPDLYEAVRDACHLLEHTRGAHGRFTQAEIRELADEVEIEGRAYALRAKEEVAAKSAKV